MLLLLVKDINGCQPQSMASFGLTGLSMWSLFILLMYCNNGVGKTLESAMNLGR